MSEPRGPYTRPRSGTSGVGPAPAPGAFGPLPAWVALALVLVLMVQFVPSTNRPLTWVLGLIALYLLLTNADKWAHVVNQLVGGLKP